MDVQLLLQGAHWHQRRTAGCHPHHAENSFVLSRSHSPGSIPDGRALTSKTPRQSVHKPSQLNQSSAAVFPPNIITAGPIIVHDSEKL